MRLSAREKRSIIIKELLLKIATANYFVFKRVIKKELHVQPKDKILDLGCGTGILAPLFAKKNYTGIDIDEKLIAFAKEEYPGYTFQHVNAAKLDFPKASFDKVLIVGVIHHLDQKTNTKAMELLKRIVKKEGTILAIEAIPPINKLNIISKILRAHDEGHHIVTMDAYRKVFKKYFLVQKNYQQHGGLFDYGVFVLRN